MEFKPQPANEYVIWMCRRTNCGTGQRSDLCGWGSAGGNAANRRTRSLSRVANFSSGRDQRKRGSMLRRRRRVHGLVTQMANRAAGFGRAVVMVMVPHDAGG